MNKAYKRFGNKLDVVLSETRVGTISVDQSDKSFFAFDPDYLDNPDRPELGLFFRKSDGGINDRIQSYRTKIHPFFSNLLPEGKLREYLATKLDIKQEREFYLLAALGSDLPGAVVVAPAGIDRFSLDSTAEEHKDESKVLKFSLAGVQLKFSAILEPKGGLTIRASGIDGDHIIKLPSTHYDRLPEAEFASMRLAKLMGIDTAEVNLVDTSSIANLPSDIQTVGDAQSLVVKRFDRTYNKRIHIEDFAQVFGKFPGDKYEGVAYHDLAHVIWSVSGLDGLKEFVRRLVFTIGIGNADMHLKNWSLIYRDGKNPELSPAYDFVPVIGFHADNKLALSLGREKVMTEVTLDHFAKFADKAGVSVKFVNTIVKEAVEQFQATWTENKGDLPFPEIVRNTIDIHLSRAELFKYGRTN